MFLFKTMIRAIFILFLVHILSSALFAQRNAKMDSILNEKKTYSEIVIGINQMFSKDVIEKILKEEENDNVRIKLINALCWKNFNSNPQKAMGYAKMQTELAEKINDKDALEAGYDNFGFLYKNFGEYDKSISYLLKSLTIKEEKKDSSGIAVCLNGIGGLYFNMENFPSALDYMFRTLQMDSLLHNDNNMPVHYGNIGNCYANMGQHDKALQYYLVAEHLSHELGQVSSSANLMNIGTVYVKKLQYVKAQEYLDRALTAAEKSKDVSDIISANIQLGDLYAQKKEFDKAIKYCSRALELSRQNNLKSANIEASRTLADIYSRMGNFQKAYEYHKQYSDVKDTVLNQESGKQIAEMQTKYETEKKEQQITLLNKDKELQDAQVNRQKIVIWSVAAGFFVVLLLSIFIFRERRKSEKLLLNILPAETARELKANGKATAKHYEQVTVMFTDFKGFTTIVEKLSAEELVNELDFLFRKFDEIISKYPIEKIKTIGDAYMCAGGLPTANSTNAKDIVNAALEIQEWMISQNGKWNLRIGIHTGAVTAGVVGDKKFAYDIWGDAVNTASRMESSGEAGKINISASTYEYIKSDFECEYRGKIPAKNKGEIGMYFVAS